MLFKKASNYFLSPELKNNPLHPDYEGVYGLVSGVLWAVIFLWGMALILYLNNYPLPVLFYNGLSILIVLPSVRRNLQEPAFLINGFFLYLIYFPAILKLGGICSSSLALLYPFLLGGLLGLPKYGICYVGGNIFFLLFLYFYTPAHVYKNIWDTKLFALLIHLLSTLLTGALFWFMQKKKDTMMIQNKDLQNNKINTLNSEVARRTKELNNMRQTFAADFHDETGNMLSAITRQAALLKLQPDINANTSNIVEHIIANTNQLYASSRHFIWNLNNDSDDPKILFNYLTSFGQLYYNQFDVSFSAENSTEDASLRLEPFAAINLIFIFKEAMNNVIKHADARGVILKMLYKNGYLQFSLTDDGAWKEPETKEDHHGLSNMEKRCAQNSFGFAVNHINGIGTRVEIAAPCIVKQTVETSTV